VSQDDSHRTDDIPEADLIDQLTPVEPVEPATDEPTPTGPPPGAVDEADWLEQQTPVNDSEEDYPRGAGEQ
jgi:hypothetical protein